jgi:hypothetical protein
MSWPPRKQPASATLEPRKNTQALEP